MPANCSADVQAVIAHIDEVFSGTNTTAINQIKDLFGLGVLSHLDDAASARESSALKLGLKGLLTNLLPVRNNLWSWQSLQPDTGPDAIFFQFCDALEVKNGFSAPASGWGTEYALPAWGNFFKTVTLPASKRMIPGHRILGFTDRSVVTIRLLACGDFDVETCFGTYDPNNVLWTNTTIDKWVTISRNFVPPDPDGTLS